MGSVSGWITALAAASDVAIPASALLSDERWLFFDSADGQPKYMANDGIAHPFPSVSAFNGRTGAITPIQADYDSFFLTSAEGDAAYVPLARNLTAGAGLTGGGNLTADRTFNVVANGDGTIVVNADDIQVGVLPASGGNLASKIITNAKMADVTTATFKGRTTAGTGTPEDLTTTQATALLNLGTSSLKGLLSTSQFIKLTGMHRDIVADGGADPTGIVDSTAIWQTINDSMPNGGLIFVPQGNYKIAGTVNITSSNLRIVGTNRRASIIEASSATGDMFNISGDAVMFENLRFSTTGSNAALRTANFALNFTSASDSSGVRACDILFQWSAIHSSGGLQFFDDVNIREYGANAPNGACILVDGLGDRYIHRLTTDNGSNPTGFAGVRVTECSSLEISDSNIIHATIGLALEPATGKTVPSIEAVNCFFDSGVKGMAITPAGTGSVFRSKFTGCWFGSNSTAGVEMNGLQWDGITFENCDFYQSVNGISCPTGGGKWAVADSRFAQNSTAAINVTASAGHKFLIYANDIGPQAAFTANGTGILIAAGTYGSYAYEGNNVSGNTTAGISDLGSVATTDQKRRGGNLGSLLKGPIASLAAPQATVSTTNTAILVARIPANSVQVNDYIRLECHGISSLTGTVIFNVRVGATGTAAGGVPADGAAWTAITSAAQLANQRAGFSAMLVVRSIGASGTVQCEGVGYAQAAVLPTFVAAVTTPTAVTTAVWFITIACTCSTGTWTAQEATITVL